MTRPDGCAGSNPAQPHHRPNHNLEDPVTQQTEPTADQAWPAAHYPGGILDGAHPGTAADCPDARCRQQATATPDQALRERIKAALTAAVVLPGKVPDDEEQVVLDDLTDAVLPLFAEEREAEAHPPIHRWRVEHVDGGEWVPASGLKENRDEAVAQLDAGKRARPLWADGTPVQRRLVRETTTYTVDGPAPAGPVAAADLPGAAS